MKTIGHAFEKMFFFDCCAPSLQGIPFTGNLANGPLKAIASHKKTPESLRNRRRSGPFFGTERQIHDGTNL
jgi:hypothetical protein